MICKNCNSVVADGAKFCASCGTPVEQPAAPAAPVATAAVCRSCGSQLAEGIKFCAVCGTAVEAPAAFQPVVPAPPVAPAAPAPVAAPQPVAPAAAVPVAAPQPVAPAAPAPVAAPQPVNDVVSQPVQAAAPVSEIPQPARESAPLGAVPQPVNDVIPQAANASAPVDAGMANGFGQAPVAPAYTAPQATGIDMDIAGIDMDAASVAAVKPVKKSKVGLWIGLGAAGVVAAAAAVGGLCFRGVVANLFMGDSKYAVKIEGDTIKTLAEGATEVTAEEKAQMVEAISSAISSMSSVNNDYGSSDEMTSAFAGVDFADIISTYNESFVQVYGADGVVIDLDADIDLTAEGKESFGDAASVDEVLKVINDSTFSISYQAAEDAMAAEVSATDAEGFTINARGIVNADGTVAVMFPFATDKAIKATIEMDGTVSSAEAVDFELDPTEIERIGTELVNIYLTYFEQAEITIDKGSLKAGDAEADGRLITVVMDEELIADMTEAMITFMIDDDYFMEKIGEFMEIAGEDYSEADIKDELEESIDELEDEITYTFEIKTVVDNNGNILAKYYGIDDDETGEDSVTYVGGETNQGLLIVSEDEDFLTADILPTNETDGKIEIVVEDADTEIAATVNYEGVKTEKYLNTLTTVGKFDVEIEAEDGTIGLTIDAAIDGDKLTNKFSMDLDKYGTMAFTVAVKPEQLDLTAIPSGALDFSNTDNWTEEESKTNAQYMLDALNDIKAKCDANTSSTFAGLISPMVDSGITYFEDLLTPMASYEDISALSDGISEIMVQLSSVYDANYEYVSDATYNECSDLYDELDDLYDEVAYAYEMDMETYNTLSDKASDLADKAAELCDKIVEEADTAREQAASSQNGFAGLWQAAEIIQSGEVSSPDDWGFSSDIYIFEDGSYYWDWNGTTTYGEWESEGDVLYFYEDDILQEFVLSDNMLSYEADGGIVVVYEKGDF